MINTVNLEANGISTFIINTANQLVKNNINVTILAPNKVDDKLVDDLKRKGVHVKEILERNSNPIKYFKCLKRYLSLKKFDIVHVNGNSTTMAIELFAAKLAGIKKRIAHSHNTTTQHPIINRTLRPLFELSVNGRLACNRAAGKWLFKKNKFTVIPNGIDLFKYKFNEKTRKDYRKKIHIKDNEILLGHVGEFNYQKNQIFLIELLKKLPSTYKLVLIGQGEKIHDIKNRVKILNIKDRVIFTGVINNVPDYLNAMDIFVLPSHFEGQPFVLVEAAAAGLNCIISNSISKEVNVSNNVTFCTLNVKKWIRELRENKWTIQNRKSRSETAINELSKCGYNIQDNTNKLIKYYDQHEF
ncbi:glycosyltransferase [Lactobacillus sp. UMNPBX4]|uniref:glycosyltransferase n=1 Tax=Lactobacillus sp. UMNPBX4 TaxID=2042043 RepID=UPI00130445CC|nr:glycosyltransferase [Lactobacillus sp. UMNPBX4]